MRRTFLAIVTTITGLVMLLSFKSHTAIRPIVAATSSPPSVVSSPGATSSTGSGTSRGGSSNTGTKTVTGDLIDTRWGPVQVKVTVTDGKITSSDAVVYPQGTQRDVEINTYAIPMLNQEAVGASTANIDMVSGATYTSDGYVQSLQSALNKAKG